MNDYQLIDELNFSPNYERNSINKLIFSQGMAETKLVLKNYEQLILTFVIPLFALIIGYYSSFKLGTNAENKIDILFPAVLGMSIISTSFTGQAIATSFDRRYGALKRLGSTTLPLYVLFIGKFIATFIVIIIQFSLFGCISILLGWRTNLVDLILLILFTFIGTICFLLLGLFFGGTTKAEIVLAGANLIWFVCIMLIGVLVSGQVKTGTILHLILNLLPPGALSMGLSSAQSGSFSVFSLLILVVWSAFLFQMTRKYFSYIDND